MEVGRIGRIVSVAMAALTVAQAAMASETVKLRRGLVIPVRFQDELTMRENRPGDRFSAVVENDRDLPDRTVLQGRVVDMVKARDRQPGYMDLEFHTIILPDGTRQDIQAVPIRLDDKAVRRGSDGRFTAKKKLEDSSKYVVGGMVGGYLIGRILGDKHAGGIMLGALAGILMAESERSSSANEVVIKRDAKMGALIERDVTLDFDGRNYDREDRYGDPRNDRGGDSRDGYNPFDPRNRDRDRDARRPNDAREDLRLEFEGKAIRFESDAQPYMDGDVWMVPLADMARQVGMSVDDSNSRRIYVEDDDTVLILEQDSRNYRLNGKREELPLGIAKKNDILYVPIDAFLAAKNGQIRKIGT